MEKYSLDDIRALRESVIELRDEALAQNDFQWSVTLSHVVAAMAQLIETQEKTNDNPVPEDEPLTLS